MSHHVSIVMYHYVRDLERTPYPRIKALAVDAFREQIAYIRSHYSVIGVESLLAAVRDPKADGLPPRALLLTFDDGYADHYRSVVPILADSGLTACFFPSAMPAREKRVLGVNKIQFVLAAASDEGALVDEIFRMLEARREEYPLKDRQYYYRKLSGESRYDNPDVTVLKRLLQRELPRRLRTAIVDELFEKHVTKDEADFASELYMSEDQLRSLVGAGMHVGSHGYRHEWLDALGADEQRREIASSLSFLESLGIGIQNWLMCYPYGGYDESLLAILREMKCGLGFATAVDIADLREHDPLLLPRLDTNDLPKDRRAPANEWTRRAARLA